MSFLFLRAERLHAVGLKTQRVVLAHILNLLGTLDSGRVSLAVEERVIGARGVPPVIQMLLNTQLPPQ